MKQLDLFSEKRKTTYAELNIIMLNNPDLFKGLTPEREIKFKEWLPDNMAVYHAFVKYAKELRNYQIRNYYSARAIWERLRWDTMVSDTGKLFKLSDLNMPFVSWLSMEAEPDLAGMFQKRKNKTL